MITNMARKGFGAEPQISTTLMPDHTMAPFWTQCLIVHSNKMRSRQLTEISWKGEFSQYASLAFVMPLVLGSISCLTPHSFQFSFEAVEPVLFLTFSRRELGPLHCSPLRSAVDSLQFSSDLRVHEWYSSNMTLNMKRSSQIIPEKVFLTLMMSAMWDFENCLFIHVYKLWGRMHISAP